MSEHRWVPPEGDLMDERSGYVTFVSKGLGERRDEIVKRLRFPTGGVKTVDADTLVILHARLYQGEFTQEELAKYIGSDVTITAKTPS